MNNEVLWLARLGIDAGLFTRGHASSICDGLGPKGELMDFAQELIDEGIVEDVAGAGSKSEVSACFSAIARA